MMAEIGDIVKVPKMSKGRLGSTAVRVAHRLLEAEVLAIDTVGSYPRFTVRRSDGEIQRGNGHMIREIVKKKGE